MLRLLGLTALLMGVAGFAFAGIQTAPEIDASTGVAALTLLSGGLIVLRFAAESSSTQGIMAP